MSSQHHKHQLQQRFRVKSAEPKNYLWQIMANQMAERLAYFKIKPKRICLLGPAIAELKQLFLTINPEIEIDEAPKQWQLKANDYDCVIINGVLAWFDDPAQLLQDVYHSLTEGGLLLFSTLGPDTLRDCQIAAQQQGWQPRVDALVDLHHWGDCLLKAGFKDPVMDRLDCAIAFDDPKDWFVDWQSMQLKDPSAAAIKHLIAPKKWQHFLASLPRQSTGQWQAAFEIIQGHAWAQGKDHHAVDVKGEVSISLDSLRAQMPSKK